jgi:uridine kinase
MKRPYIIAINSVSGGGKTALAKLLQESLPASVVFCFDDFDQTNLYPEDFYEWWKRGADLREFDCPGMGKAVDDEIQRRTTEFIIMDYPFGRDHPRFQTLIDLSVFVDTPLAPICTLRKPVSGSPKPVLMVQFWKQVPRSVHTSDGGWRRRHG